MLEEALETLVSDTKKDTLSLINGTTVGFCAIGCVLLRAEVTEIITGNTFLNDFNANQRALLLEEKYLTHLCRVTAAIKCSAPRVSDGAKLRDFKTLKARNVEAVKCWLYTNRL